MTKTAAAPLPRATTNGETHDLGLLARPRRLRGTDGIRDLVREHRLAPARLVYPLFICEGTSGRLFEVNRAHEVVWEWINPFLNNNSRGEATVSIYRAHRYAHDHPAIADKDLDPSRFGNLNQLNGLI